MSLNDNISDFFKDLKDRVSSPFFSSFIISWLLFNWKVPIALIFYNAEDLKADGYNSFIQLLKGEVVPPQSFWLPLGSAFLYCLVFPALRNGIIAAQSWYKSWGSELELKYTKGVVSISKYLILRQNLEKRTETLEKVLSLETKTQEDFENLRSEKLQLQGNVTRLQKEIADWKKDTSMLNGDWRISGVDYNNNVPNKNPNEIIIQNNSVFTEGNRTQSIADIENFHFNPETSILFFVYHPTNENTLGRTLDEYFFLQPNETLNKLEGRSNKYRDVTFTKLDKNRRKFIG